MGDFGPRTHRLAWRRPLQAAVAGAAVLAIVACSITIGPDDWDSLSLGVPFRQQESSFYCAAACVQMWRLYCGYPDNMTQSNIYTYMGGNSGVSGAAIANGVNAMTCTQDAYRSLNTSDDDGLAEEITKQICSVDAGWPAIPIIQGGFHAVILDGGEFHSDSSAHYWWDTLLVHDPMNFSGDYPVSAAQWTEANGIWFRPTDSSVALDQVLRGSAIGNWMLYLGQYGDSVGVWDMGCDHCIKYRM